MRTISPYWRRYTGVILPLLLIIGWEVISYIINNPFILVRFDAVIAVLADPFRDRLGSGSLISNAILSIERVGLGFFVASAIAIPLGIAMGWSERLYQFFDSTIQILRPIPPFAWLPLSIAWYGIGLTSKVFIIFIGAFFPILINTIDGIKNVRKTWLEVAATLGASERQLLVKVVIPGAAPLIWTGLRIGFGIAWMVLVAAELLPGTTSGLGYLIMYAYNFGQFDVIVAGMIVIGLIGISIDFLFQGVERRKFSWRRQER